MPGLLIYHSANTCFLLAYVHIKIYIWWWWLMMITIPFSRMVMIGIIIMAFSTS